MITSGIQTQRIEETPVSVIDLETTGLNPGPDRVVEVSVARIEAGKKPELVFDTLVNPERNVSASDIHGIYDEHIVDAPRFSDISGDLLDAIAGTVIASYNIYFDIKFLEYELNCLGIHQLPPYFCLMYMRPLLGLGKRCSLFDACMKTGISYEATHIASDDALAAACLMEKYYDDLRKNQIETFNDLKNVKRYKFMESFSNSPFNFQNHNLKRYTNLISRAELKLEPDPVRAAMATYWDALKDVVSDLTISEEELFEIIQIRNNLGLSKKRVRALHARIFASAISQFCDDQELDESELMKLRKLYHCLSHLGWAPGE